MTVTIQDNDRDIDADATIKIGALSASELTSYDLRTVLDGGQTRSALTCELKASLRLLTPPVRRAEPQLQSVAPPTRHVEAPPEVSRPAPRRQDTTHPATARSATPLFRIVLGTVEQLIAASWLRVLSLGRTISRLTADLFAETRRERARAFYRTQRERCWHVFQFWQRFGGIERFKIIAARYSRVARGGVSRLDDRISMQ
jgi:hypothetical protein